MADLSKIKLNGTEYDLKDAVARENIANFPTNISAFTNDAGYLKRLIISASAIYDYEYDIPDSDSDEESKPTNYIGITAMEIWEAFKNGAEIYLTDINSSPFDGILVPYIGTYHWSDPAYSPMAYFFVDHAGTQYTASIDENGVFSEYFGYGISASNSLPLMDGTASRGSETSYARGDHKHPTDISRAPINSPNFQGTPQAPTATAGTNTKQIATTAFVQNELSTKANITDLPLIITGSCAFGTSLINGIDTPISITNISHTVQDIAIAVNINRPIYIILSDNSMKLMLQYSAFDGTTYYFTNAYDPFTATAYNNESFNITVKAINSTDISDSTYDAFTYMITYNKNAFVTQSDMNTAINEAIGGITEFDTQVVQSLPQTGIEGTIYFTPNNHGTNDIYDEFIYVNNAWEKIGNTQVDLTGYARTDQLANVAITGSYNNLVDTPDIPTKISDLVDDSDFITLNDVPTELPTVSNADNDKVLTVDNGTWTAKTPAIQFSGDYNDLTNKPTLFDGDYNSLSNKPTLFSGDYEDLSNKPTIPSATVVTQTITSGVKIAEINGTAIYAPAYANGDQIAY